MGEKTPAGGTQVSTNDGPHEDLPIEASQATKAHPDEERCRSTAEAISASQGAPLARSASAAAPAFLEANFPPIGDYAFLSDCENTCLVAPTGAVEWFCLPAPHDPSIVGAILDRSAGSFRFGPTDTAVPAAWAYLPGTMVLTTTWQTRTGWLSVRDFLAVGPWHRTTDRSTLHRRTPGDFDACHLLVRIATCLEGTVELTVNCEVSFDYGRADASWAHEGPGYQRVVTTNAEHLRLTLGSDLSLGIEGRSVKARHRLSQGESCYTTLYWGDSRLLANAHDVDALLAETTQFWRGWLDGGRFPDHPWRGHLQRGALTLKALTYRPTGALLAAPSTSLPEHPGGQRNWDYRYTWVRDSFLTMWTLQALGFDAEADDFVAFLGDTHYSSASGADARAKAPVLFQVDGQQPRPEGQLDHLTGYGGSRPVRTGNAASAQEQLDSLGAVVDCIYRHTRSRDSLSERSWQLVVAAVTDVLERWRNPDQSIWESRGAPQHHTYSKVSCWVAADRGAQLAALHGDTNLAERLRQEAQTIHDDVCQHGVDAKGRFVQTYGSEELDASLLMLPLVRFLPGDDPRIRTTVLAIADELTEDGFVRRYRPETTDDGLDEPEATFLACSFWLVSALSEIGELEWARRLCERLLRAASGLGLYAEEIEPMGRHLGNFPQALTHLSLINAVLHIVAAEHGSWDAWKRSVTPANWWTPPS
jgi:GH15 family glucan-1,4-alpha-glucosidase